MDALRASFASASDADRHAAQNLGLGNVRRDHERAGQQFQPHGGQRVVVEEPIAALGDHHRVDDHQRQFEFGDGRGHGLDDRGRRQHAGLRGRNVDVRRDGLDLRGDQVGGQRLDGHDADVFWAVMAVIADVP